jgi:hypothetical protein
VRDAQKPDHVSLNTLIGRLKEGRYVIPDFQREFEWEPWDIKELVKSIFLDYYIGSLLLWRGNEDNFKSLSCEAIYGFVGSGRPEYIVLDGQQRLTAMYYAFLAPNLPLPHRKTRAFYFVRVDKFVAGEYDEAFHYDWASGETAKVFNNTEAQFAKHVFPCSVVGAAGWEPGNWVQGYEKHWTSRAAEARTSGDAEAAAAAEAFADGARKFGEELRGITEQFQISYVELDRQLGIEKICDIFTQINSRGVRLDVFDLMNAMLKPKDLQLKVLWREAAPRLQFVDTPKMNVYILQVMSILRQAYCSPKYLYFLLPGVERPVRDPDGTRRKEVLVPNVADFEARWNGAVAVLERAMKLLRHPQEYGVNTANYLPYVSILPVFASLLSLVDGLPAERRLDGRRKFRHWYWASVFNARYSGSVESTSARDFQDVRAWLDDDGAEPSLIGEFKNRFNTLDLRNEVKRGTSVYNAIFNLLVIQGARDWVSGNVPQPDELDDHHIVPAAWGAKYLSGNQVNTILNRSPLTARTNREVISDRLPNVYLPKLIAQNGRAHVEDILASHFVTPAALDILLRDPFTPEDFEAFIAERQRTFQRAIESLLVNERLDLPPHLRELDERIEKIELGLRDLVNRVTAGDEAALPPHILQLANERIQKEQRRNAAFDSARYVTLAGKLEFADLRELEAALVSKSLWSSFEPRFANRETLVGKFGQLANLRNGIRHSRSVDEVTRKEGEAAILWFEQIARR